MEQLLDMFLEVFTTDLRDAYITTVVEQVNILGKKDVSFEKFGLHYVTNFIIKINVFYFLRKLTIQF